MASHNPGQCRIGHNINIVQSSSLYLFLFGHYQIDLSARRRHRCLLLYHLLDRAIHPPPAPSDPIRLPFLTPLCTAAGRYLTFSDNQYRIESIFGHAKEWTLDSVREESPPDRRYSPELNLYDAFLWNNHHHHLSHAKVSRRIIFTIHIHVILCPWVYRNSNQISSS